MYRRVTMIIPKYDSKQLCEKISGLFPDIGKCGIDLDVHFDEKEKIHIVQMKKGNKVVKTSLEPEDVALCMNGKQCVSLGIHLAQFRD
jgi:hypothetical protein